MKKYVKPIAQDLGSVLPSAQGDSCKSGSVATVGPATCKFGAFATGGLCDSGASVAGCEFGALVANICETGGTA